MGTIDDLPDRSGERPSALSCEDPDRPAPLSDARRLTHREYVQALHSLFGQATLDALASSIELVPRDRTGRAFDNENLSITREHVKAYFLAAEAIGKHFEQDASARAALVPCLDTGADDACVRGFVTSFGARAFRRKLEPAEVDRWVAVFELGAASSPAAGLAELLAQLLQAPDFLFKLELRGSEVEGRPDELKLTPEELAVRLSFLLWGQPPDDELAAHAASGELADSSVLEVQAERLLAAPRARVHLREFFAQWLLLDQLPDVEAPPVWVQAETELAGLNAAMVSEVERLTEWIVFEQKGSLSDLLTTHLTLIDSPSLASVYGVSMPSDPSLPVELSDTRRGGLLGRLALVANPDGSSHPILRGARIRKQILCGKLEQPDASNFPDDTFQDPPADPTLTTRQRFEQKTSGAECAACHEQINPLGFALEGIDGLGRLRDQERVFSETGELLAELSLNTEVQPWIEGTADAPLDGAAELGERIAHSSLSRACMAEQWYRFSERQPESDAECILRDLSDALVLETGGSILEMLRRHVTSREFSHRRYLRQEDP